MFKRFGFIIALPFILYIMFNINIKEFDKNLNENTYMPIHMYSYISIIPYGLELDIKLNDNIKMQYFDLAQKLRWDFIPVFEPNKPSTNIAEYLSLMYAQNLLWDDNFNIIRNELNNRIILTHEYVQTFANDYFGAKLDPPVQGEYYGHYYFDGQKYIEPNEPWGEPPLFEVFRIRIKNQENRIIYKITLRQYHWVSEEAIRNDEVKEIISSNNIDNTILFPFRDVEIEYFIDVITSRLCYLSKSETNL